MTDSSLGIIVGKISSQMKKIYNTVKTAQGMAIKEARPGLKISGLVRRVHNYIRKKGFGKYILHGLGHGIGKKIHDC